MERAKQIQRPMRALPRHTSRKCLSLVPKENRRIKYPRTPAAMSNTENWHEPILRFRHRPYHWLFLLLGTPHFDWREIKESEECRAAQKQKLPRNNATRGVCLLAPQENHPLAYVTGY